MSDREQRTPKRLTSRMVKVAGVFVVLVLILAEVLFLRRTPEPRYKGRTISAYMGDWAAKKRPAELPSALQAMGTNALPYAVRNLAWNDSKWRSNYVRLQARLPAQLQKVFRKPGPLLATVDGANVFFYIGSNSIPYAIALLKHDSVTVRRSAAWGLCSLRRQSPAANQAIPALIPALSDPDRDVRFNACLAFIEFGPDASNAVPALTRVTADVGIGPQTNDFFYLRAVAARALGKLGPTAGSALPILKAALTESNAYFRGTVATAIWRIAGDVETTLPVLLKEMPGTSEHNKWDWIIALGEMGPQASEAVPQLQVELRQDKEEWVLRYVTNALAKIQGATPEQTGDPDVAFPPIFNGVRAPW